MIETLVHAEQLDAIVGKEKTGLFALIPRDFPVSVDFPPPIVKIISACCTKGFFINSSTFSYVASPPYQIKSKISRLDFSQALIILSFAALIAL